MPFVYSLKRQHTVEAPLSPKNRAEPRRCTPGLVDATQNILHKHRSSRAVSGGHPESLALGLRDARDKVGTGHGLASAVTRLERGRNMWTRPCKVHLSMTVSRPSHEAPTGSGRMTVRLVSYPLSLAQVNRGLSTGS